MFQICLEKPYILNFMSLEEGGVCVFYSVLSDDSRIEFTSYADSTLKMAFNSMPEIVRAHSFRVGILTFKILIMK